MTAAVSVKPAASAGVAIAVCLAVAALEGYDIQAFGVAAPRFAPELGLNPSQVGLAGSIAIMGLVVGALVGGWLADRIGRKPVIFWSTAAFGLFSVATALSVDFPTLCAARFVAGLGFGGVMPNLIAVACDVARPERRSATVTALFCGLPSGGTVVALVARFGGEIDWRTLFMIGGVLPLAILPLIHILLPETRPEPAPGADRRLLPALFGGRRAAPTLLLWLTFLLTMLVVFLMLNWLPSLVVAKGFTRADGDTASVAFNLAGAVGALTIGAVADRLGFRAVLVSAFTALALVLWVMATSSSLLAVVMLAGLTGAFVLGANFVLYALAPTLYPTEVRAAGSGAAVAVGRIGSILGPLLGGELRAAGASPGEVLMALVPMVVVAGGAALLLTTIGKPYADPAA